MKNKIYKWIVGVLVVGILLFWGVDYFGTESDVQFKVGALLPLTGRLASYGEDVRAGLELSRRDLAKEGINIEIVYEDSAGDPKTAIAGANKLVNLDKVSVIIGAPGSSANLAVAPFMEQTNTVFLVMSNTAKLNDAGPYTFKLLPDIDEEVRMIFGIFEEKSFKRIAVVYDSTSESNITGYELTKAQALKNGVVIEDIAIDGKAADFRSQLSRIKNTKTDAVYFLTNEKVAGIVMKQLREIGVAQPVFGWSAMDGDEFFQGAGELAEGVMITDLPFSCTKSAAAEQYCRKYIEQYPKTAQLPYGAYGYDALQNIGKVVAGTLVGGGTTDQKEIAENIAKAYTSSTMQGVAGTYTFNIDGNSTQNDFVIRKAKEGVFVDVR